MKQKRPYSQSLPIAQRIIDRLTPACRRIEFAGSLLRKEALIGDIELLAIPDGHKLDELLHDLPVELTKNGPRYKQFIFTSTQGRDFQVDLYVQTPDTWGVNFMIRTGSADFSKWMVSNVFEGGACPASYWFKDALLWHKGQIVPTPEERDVFEALGVAWVAPEHRKGGMWGRVNYLTRWLGQLHLEPGWSLSKVEGFIHSIGATWWGEITTAQLERLYVSAQDYARGWA